MKNRRTNLLKSAIQEKGRLCIKVCGKSMLPGLLPGDIIEVKGTNCLRQGDVVAFYKGNLMVVHRIFKISRNKIFTKGDFCLFPDKREVFIKDIIGVVDRVYPSRFFPRPNLNSVFLKIVNIVSGNFFHLTMQILSKIKNKNILHYSSLIFCFFKEKKNV